MATKKKAEDMAVFCSAWIKKERSPKTNLVSLDLPRRSDGLHGNIIPAITSREEVLVMYIEAFRKLHPGYRAESFEFKKVGFILGGGGPQGSPERWFTVNFVDESKNK